MPQGKIGMVVADFLASRCQGDRKGAPLPYTTRLTSLRGIDIETITGRSHTVDGVRIMRHIGFKQLPSVTKDSNFRLNLRELDAPFAQQYREALQRSRQASTKKK